MNPNGVTVEIGGSLREARRRLGLELSEAEAATLIRARYLEALEHDRFDDLPAGAYRVVFLREYAEFLGLDSRILVDEYLLRSMPAPLDTPQPARRAVDLSAARLLDRVSKVHVAVAAALLLGGLAVWRLGSSGSTTPPVTHELTAARAPRPAPVRPVHATARHPAPAHEAAAAPVLSLVAARGSCWLLVRRGSSTGPVLYEQTLAQGGHVRFGVSTPLWIRVGAPWNLDAKLGGRTLQGALPSSTGDVVATARGLRRV